MAWANTTDATESGAYAVALAAIEQSRGLYAVRRAETFTVADYYIEPLNGTTRKLENCYRLEISGTDLATLEVRRCLKVKLKQAKLGNSPLPVIAAAAEIQAIHHLTPDEPRTLGITVVSAIALSFKAKAFPQAKQIAYHWLDRQQLPKFAILQVEEMLREILMIEAVAIAG